MIELLEHLDTRLFLFFNKNHTPAMDAFMGAVAYKYTWIPLYLILLFFAWRKVRSGIWLVVLSVALLITFSDQMSVHLFKNVFERYRPCHNLLIKDQVQLINGACGGLYGFVSSHAANAFALTIFLSLFFRNRMFAMGMLFWAALVCYSRVYGGVHYPFDILGGAMLGTILGVVAFGFYKHYHKKYVA